MKKSLSSFLVLLIAFSLNAQVTLTSSMPFGPQTFHIYGANTTGFSLPSIGINQHWDYSSLVQAGESSFGNIAAANPVFPTASFVDTMLSISFIAGTYYYSDNYSFMDADGVYILGNEIRKQDYNISATTMGANDSCKIALQQNVFASPVATIAFPATMSSSWQYNYTNKVDFTLSIAAYALVDVPCSRVSHISKLDTVISWGTMRLPFSGGVGKDYDCLLIQRTVVQKDSFYMSGSPAPAPMLSAFGLSQGMETVSNRYLFWRPESAYPLMIVNFGSSNFTTPSSIYWDANAQEPNALSEVETGVVIYPNPAGNSIQINGLSNGSYHIYSVEGKLAANGFIQNNEQNIDVAELENGLYFIKLEGGNVSQTKRISICR